MVNPAISSESLPDGKPKSTENQLLCPDWVASTTSNVHIAKDRGWFISYEPYESFVQCDPISGNTMKVEGIGTVLLHTIGGGDPAGPEYHTRLRLIHVLHVPQAFCNTIRAPFCLDSTVSFEPSGNCKGFLKDKNGKIVANFQKDHPMFAIKLYDHPVGPSVFAPDDQCTTHVTWPQSEIQKWLDQRRISPAIGERPYTRQETEWLKERYGREYNFLRTYGLSVHREDERDEGRTIARELMKRART